MKKRLTDLEIKFKKLISVENLTLAWNRINADTNNLSYKNYYRTLFWYYEYDLDSNLKNLSKKLENKVYAPSKSLKVYKPKQSGLQRPFTLLEIEDLIVYQAIANIIIPAFSKKRSDLENQYVFSNLFTDNLETNIFLFQNWKKGYKKYKKNISQNFHKGLYFTAHFDLAAYYDTIDQNSLLPDIFKDTRNEIGQLLYACLQEWSNKTVSNSRKIAHGIPQGPLSSNVFAELFLLPIDKYLVERNICYSRYVDDIVIQGKTIEEVQRAVILLDIKCKEKGLVPQSSKFSIYEAKTVEEAIGKNPSLSNSEKADIFSDEQKVLKLFSNAFVEETYDSSIIRYILKVYEKSDILIDKIILEFSNHYEFAEEFCTYLKRFVSTKSNVILGFIISFLTRIIPYDYAESELWSLLAELAEYENIYPFVQIAMTKLQNHPSDALKYGIYKYLSKLDDNRFIKFLAHEESKLLLALEIKNISTITTGNANFVELINFYSDRKSSLLSTLLFRHLYFMYQYNEISESKYNTFIAQLPKINEQRFETINFYIKNDYEIDSTIDWKLFFGDSFEHANTIFYHAHLAGKRHKSEWLNAIDSFNDLLIRAFIKNLNSWNPLQRTPPLIVKDRKGKDKVQDIGCLLDKGTPLAKNYPLLIENALGIHNRRCKNPLSHAIDEKTFQFTSFVTKTEYYEYFDKEKIFLSEIVRISNEHI